MPRCASHATRFSSTRCQRVELRGREPQAPGVLVQQPVGVLSRNSQPSLPLMYFESNTGPAGRRWPGSESVAHGGDYGSAKRSAPGWTGVVGILTKAVGIRPSKRGRAIRKSGPGGCTMMFSTRAEYGVRVMIQLGRRHGAGPVSLADIAEAEDLPLPYLEHLVARLRKADLVSSTRGAHGGYELARGPGEITMAEVVNALEGTMVPMQCFTEPGTKPGALQSRDGRVRALRDQAPVDPRPGRRHAGAGADHARRAGAVRRAWRGAAAPAPGPPHGPPPPAATSREPATVNDCERKGGTDADGRSRDPEPARRRRGQGDPQGSGPDGLAAARCTR